MKLDLNLTKIYINISIFVVVFILYQTLYFKFTAAPESVRLFTKLGLEPFGRIGVGLLELLTGLFLVFGSIFYKKIGAILAFLLMLGAIMLHLTVLGIYHEKSPVLFILAVVAAFFSGFLVVSFYKNEKR